ncbi:MAG: hypothetical protein RLZZ593_1052 [Bacteroidota bacterium]|jgi:hypothetical protein
MRIVPLTTTGEKSNSVTAVIRIFNPYRVCFLVILPTLKFEAWLLILK